MTFPVAGEMATCSVCHKGLRIQDYDTAWVQTEAATKHYHGVCYRATEGRREQEAANPTPPIARS